MQTAKTKTTKTLATILSVIFALSLIVVLFLTSMDIVIYGNMPDWFVSECEKYDTLTQVGIEKEDLEHVTTDMFEYLRGNRDTLEDITATIHGEPNTPYFNEKECMHMSDCQKLFTAGYALRRWCIVICVVLLAVIIFISKQKDKEKSGALCSLAMGTLIATIGFIVIFGILAVLVAKDFYKYFTLFHLTFFDNDLWILDPTKDRLLMIMPEGYFIDCVKYIGIIFAAFLIILLVASIIIIKKRNTKHE